MIVDDNELNMKLLPRPAGGSRLRTIGTPNGFEVGELTAPQAELCPRRSNRLRRIEGVPRRRCAVENHGLPLPF